MGNIIRYTFMELLTVFAGSLTSYITYFYIIFAHAGTGVKFLFTNNIILVIYGICILVLSSIKGKNKKENILIGTISLLIGLVIAVLFALIYFRLVHISTYLYICFNEIMVISLMFIGVNIIVAFKNFRQLKLYKKINS